METFFFFNKNSKNPKPCGVRSSSDESNQLGGRQRPIDQRNLIFLTPHRLLHERRVPQTPEVDVMLLKGGRSPGELWTSGLQV